MTYTGKPNNSPGPSCPDSNTSLVGIGGINGDNTIRDSFVLLESFKAEYEKLKDKEEKGSGSKNSPVGIGEVNGTNAITGSFQWLKANTDSFKRLKTSKVPDEKKIASVSNNSLVGIGEIFGKNTMPGSFKVLTSKGEVKKLEDKKNGSGSKRIGKSTIQDKTKNASVSNSSLVGIGVIFGENTIDGSFNQLKTFNVEDKKLEDMKNGSSSKRNGVINRESTIMDDKKPVDGKNGSGSKNSPLKIGVINSKSTIEDNNQKNEKNGSGSNNSVVGIGVINGTNSIKDSFKRMEILDLPGKP